jgi:hypothetical protein
MDFMGGLPTKWKGHDYLFMVVDRFSKMCVMMLSKMTINEQEATNLFFGKIWVHFWILGSIVSYKDTRFINAF